MWPLLVIGVVLGATIAFFVFRKPVLGTYGYIVTLGFGGLLNLPFTEGGLKVATVLVLFSLVVAIVRALATSDGDLVTILTKTSAHWLVILIFCTMLVSLVNSRYMAASVAEIQRFAYCVSAYMLILITIRDVERFRVVFVLLVAAGLVVSILGLLEGTVGNIYNYLHYRSLFGAPLDRSYQWTAPDRIDGLIGDADFHGMYMGIIGLFAFFLYLTEIRIWLKWIWFLAMATALLNVIGAASRGAGLGSLVALVVFWAYVEMQRKWIKLALILGLFVLVTSVMIHLIPDLEIKRFYAPNVEAQTTLNLRRDNILIGLSMAKDHLVIGHGPEGFLKNYHRYRPHMTASARRLPIKPLNAYMQALVEFGIIGLSLFIVFTVLMAKSFFSLLKVTQGEDRYGIAVMFAVFCGLTFFMNTTGLFVDLIYWSVVGLGGALISIYHERLPRPVRESSQ